MQTRCEQWVAASLDSLAGLNAHEEVHVAY